MGHANMPSKSSPREGKASSLESLSRTLETLEARLSKLTPPTPRHAVREASIPPIATPSPVVVPMTAAEPAAPGMRERRKPSLADAVSEIVMRRQMLDAAPPPSAERDMPAAASAPAAIEPGQRVAETLREDRLDRRFEALAGEVESLRADGSNYALMAEVAEELQRLRQDLRTGDETRSDPRFDSMRDAFDDLRRMIEGRQSPDAIGAGMTELSADLARLTDEGADRSILNTLRAELEEMRSLFGEMARESTVAAVGDRWDAFESRYSRETARDSEARGDVKNELERLRESLRSLASEDQVRAVEKRWDDFEDRFLGTAAAAAAPNEMAISKILRDELESMREKLEGMSDTAPMKAVEARWGALEERLDSREVEASIQRLSERMGEIEASLERLPSSLGIASLEERMRAMAAGVDDLARRGREGELEHFVALEERLDEISRAIVATSLQVPAFDMAPIERIEARIATLTARVDRFADEGDSEILSLRIAELAERVEELASTAVTDGLATRIGGLADRLETVFAEIEQPQVDTAAIEERLAALALRLEDAVQPQVDPEMMRSLEGQIARLSEHLATSGGLPADEFQQDFDRRLALVEQRLEENREALIAAAREAADETALRMQAAGDKRQSEHVAQLSENLRALEELSRDSDDRSTKVFDAVHSTLLKIVDRLEQIEVEISKGEGPRPEEVRDGGAAARAAAHMAAAGVAATAMADNALSQARIETRIEPAGPRSLRDVIARRMPGKATAPAAEPAQADQMLLDERESVVKDVSLERVPAPSLDASGMLDEREANRPLEPGSGAPDIGALLERVRLQQRNKADGLAGEPAGEAETRAAARRAVKAAVAEAEMLRSPSAAGSEAERRFSLKDLVARRRKTILMGVTAVLVALAALPIGKAFLSQRGGEQAEGLNIEGAANLDETTPILGGGTPAASAPVQPAAPRPQAPASDPARVPQKTSANGVTSASGTGTVSSPRAADGAVKSSAASPSPAPSPATSPIPARTTAAALAVAPAAVGAEPLRTAALPVAKAQPAASKGITAASDPATVLASAVATLSASAAGDMPSFPEAIGTPALLDAAKANDTKALFEIGLRLLEGRGGEPKPAEALDWFAQAAKRGFAPAQYSLGTLFEKGNGVTRDTGAARDWYLLAAKQGNVRAMHNLAVLYATGVEGKSEPETAASWFEQAADLGMRDSQYNLGILYARGSGVDQNLGNSYKWFAVVAKAGDKDAEAKRDEVAKSLAPEQLRAAEAAVAGWTEKSRIETANTVDVPPAWTDPKTDETASVDMKRAVRNIQAILGKLGYDAGAPDGVAGGKTTAAIAAFRKDAGLTASGAIDETLIRALLERKNG